jgi:hypothetical protein
MGAYDARSDPRRLRSSLPCGAEVKYLNKSFSVPGADIYMTDGWWNLEPAQISKGQWIKVGEGRERYVPEGRPLPREVDNA